MIDLDEFAGKTMIKRNFRLDRTVEWAPVEIRCTLDSIELITGRQAVYQIEHRGFDIRVFAFLRPETGKLVAMGQDAVVRSNSVLPLFHRWSWYRDLHASMIVFNDPTLMLHKQLDGGWSQGHKDECAVKATADVVIKFSALLGVVPSEAVLFGTSAGGFWAMMAGAEIGSKKVVVDIPQVDMFSYHDHTPRDAMLSACYPGEPEESLRRNYTDRLRVIDRFLALGRWPESILYCQNLCDVKHVRTQMEPFKSEIRKIRLTTTMPSVDFITYERKGEDGRGHIQMERAEMVRILNSCLHDVSASSCHKIPAAQDKRNESVSAAGTAP
jgi:hypothetical protein